MLVAINLPWQELHEAFGTESGVLEVLAVKSNGSDEAAFDHGKWRRQL